MRKAVLISIRPKWCKLIVSGKKTIEIRKTRPKLETPFKCYIYCTKHRSGEDVIVAPVPGKKGDLFYSMVCSKVIGEFVCDEIDVYNYEYCAHPEIGMDYDCGDSWFIIDNEDLKNACMCYKDFRNYAGNQDVYGWHISNLKIYDEPKELSDFQHYVTSYNIETTRFQEGDCEVVRRVRKLQPLNRAPQSWCYVEDLRR